MASSLEHSTRQQQNSIICVQVAQSRKTSDEETTAPDDEMACRGAQFVSTLSDLTGTAELENQNGDKNQDEQNQNWDRQHIDPLVGPNNSIEQQQVMGLQAGPSTMENTDLDCRGLAQSLNEYEMHAQEAAAATEDELSSLNTVVDLHELREQECAGGAERDPDNGEHERAHSVAYVKFPREAGAIANGTQITTNTIITTAAISTLANVANATCESLPRFKDTSSSVDLLATSLERGNLLEAAPSDLAAVTTNDNENTHNVFSASRIQGYPSSGSIDGKLRNTQIPYFSKLLFR